jgi:uncharacterized protein Yka (UPF0111/DUF47 family)
MFKKLMPKEEKYFEDFKELVAYLLEMAQITHSFFSAPSYDKEIFLKLKPIEKRCDEVSDKISKRLNKSFITPFDREDIFSLTKKLDSIGDYLLRAAVRIDIFALEEKVEYAENLSAIVLRQIKELGIVIQHLKDRGEHINECKAVRDLETEADNIYRTALRQLFQNEKDPIKLIQKKEILEILENASDKCQSTSNVIMAIFIKNS